MSPCVRAGLLFRVIFYSLLSLLICLRIFSLFSYHIRKFLVLPCDISIIFSSVRKFTRRTVLDPTFCEVKITAAFISQCIQRTITEQAIEIFRICIFMARKKFTFFMTEIRKFFIFPIWFIHSPSPFSNPHSDYP